MEGQVNDMKTFRLLFLSLILTATQATYFSASANSTSSRELLATTQPAAATTAALQTTAAAETCLSDEQSGFLPGIEIDACRFGGDEANRLAREGILIGSNSKCNFIDLEHGNILLAPEKDIVIGTHQSKISIESGATVFVAEYGNDVIVYDLLQTKPKQVSVTVLANKQKIILEPGRMLVVTGQNTDDFEKLEVYCHCVAYHNVKPLDLHNNTVRAFVADFSIASAMVTIQPLKELTASNNRQDKLAVERLVKGAVILGDFATTITAPVQEAKATTAAIADVGGNVKVAGSSNNH